LTLNAPQSQKPGLRRHDTFENIVSDEEEEVIEHKEEVVINLQYWFAHKLITLLHVCFDNIIEAILAKLSRIPHENVFSENEFGEQGSNTMDMIFAVMNSVWFLWPNLRLFDIYRIQICHQILHFSLIKLTNHLLSNPAYCTIAGGFRLKVVKSMIVDWCQSNAINDVIFETLTAWCEQISALLLTCAVVKDGAELIHLCPSLSAAQINQILNNYNSEAVNEPLSAEIINPILEVAASEMSSEKSRASMESIAFCKQPMKAFDIRDYKLPKIILSEIGPIPKKIAENPSFEFLLNNKSGIVL